jgi:U-box domain
MSFAIEAPPSKFLCALTNTLMSDPVMSIHGHTYERTSILAWLENSSKCPITGKPLKLEGLVSNKTLRSTIIGWKQVSDYDEILASSASALANNNNGNSKPEPRRECLPSVFDMESKARAALSKLESEEKREKPFRLFKIMQKSKSSAAA